MVNKIGQLLLTSAETKYSLAEDIGGFDFLIVEGGGEFDMSVNNNSNYIHYTTAQKIIPGLVTSVYIKNGDGSSYVKYWAFD